MSKPDDGGPAVEVPLLRGGFALVSPEDAERVLALGWRLGKNGYVYCRRRGLKHALLHRFIADAISGIEVHHGNENKRDCRRKNLVEEMPTDHQRKYHSHVVRARNLASRKFPASRICDECGLEFTVNPNHRGRNRFCTKLCGNRYVAKHRRTRATALQP